MNCLCNPILLLSEFKNRCIMTAIVGILNKRGIAIAADSASTITTDKGNKVVNTETKIFQLSKHHPVAVMIYGRADFLHTPWDLIIKLYCQKRGDIARGSLKEYVDDFLKFIDNLYYIL